MTEKHLTLGAVAALLSFCVLTACNEVTVSTELPVESPVEPSADNASARISPAAPDVDIRTLVDIKTSDFAGGNLRLEQALDEPEFYCLDIFGFGSNANVKEPLSVHTCKPGGWGDLTFQVDYPQAGQIYMPAYKQCVSVTRIERGAHVFLQDCNDSLHQRFTYRADKTIEIQARRGPNPFCLVVHPADGIQTGGPSHVRREVYAYDCDLVEPPLKRWLLPEDGVGLSAEAPPPPPPSDPKLAGITGLYQAVCSGCHGVFGEGNLELQSPKLSGQSEWYLAWSFDSYLNGLRGVSEGERWGVQMASHAADLNSPNIAIDLANYIQTLPDEPAPHTIFGDTANGKRLYEENCSLCHGGDAMGLEALKSPRLAGMTDWYLLRQMYKFRDGRRGAQEGDIYGAQMIAPALSLDGDKELEDVIAYINSLPN